MVNRNRYIEQIRPFYDNEQIKILMGVRRAGKTEILKMIAEELAVKNDSSHVFFMSFELLENTPYRTALSLYQHLQEKIIDEKKYYFLLDEVQLVSDWQEVVNSLKTKFKNVSIFVTGSNSQLLDDDKNRILGGRTITFRIMPFSFGEYCDYLRQTVNSKNKKRNYNIDTDEAFDNYVKWGGFPLIFQNETDSQKQVMLESIFDSIVLRDILTRKQLKKSLYLEKIIDYAIASSSLFVSGRNIQERIEKDKMNISLPIIIEYLKAIEESFIVSRVSRFDIIGLRTLEFNEKYYSCDSAFINYKKSLISDLYGAIYETIVYNELISRGYNVKTGIINGKEVDFVATKGEEKLYMQVAYEITKENIEREFGSLNMIKDHYPKIVVSRDKVLLSQNGIQHKNIIDWLLSTSTH